MKNSANSRLEENLKNLEKFQACDVKFLIDPQCSCSFETTVEDICAYLEDDAANKQQRIIIKESFYPNS